MKLQEWWYLHTRMINGIDSSLVIMLFVLVFGCAIFISIYLARLMVTLGLD